MSFNLDNYEPVEDRIRRFWVDHPEGRILTTLVEAAEGRFIVKSEVYTDRDDARPAASDYAHEVVTQRGVNATSALENCATSATGRALANLGYSPKGARPSREEMEKARRASSEMSDDDYARAIGNLDSITDLDTLRRLFIDAQRRGDESVMAEAKARAEAVKA